MSPQLMLELERTRYAPGETVSGVVTVLEGGASRRLEAKLAFREKAGDYEHTPVEIGGEIHSGELVAGARHPFAIALPDDALPSYRSRHGELFWEVAVRSDERGRDTHRRERIEVARP